MNLIRIILIPLVLVSVLAIHCAWVRRGQGVDEWVSLTKDETATVRPSYLSSGNIWLGLSYGLAATFATFCLIRLYEYRRRAVVGAVGGVTGVAILYVAGCFLLGCCGSPILPVYLGRFGPRLLGATKPLVFAITSLSVLVGYLLVTRRENRAKECTASTCVESEADRCGPLDSTLGVATVKAGDAESPGSCCTTTQPEALTASRPDAELPETRRESWTTGWVETPVGRVRQVATGLQFTDRLGSWKARWGIGRMHYRVGPGLYAVGTPTKGSRVLVTANYKMTFDRLRSQLGGLDLWILVLDTKGINVWCAAGKGTFGTEELIRRVEATKLAEVVSQRTLILPQLGASGVSAHEVRKATGFRVVYGPVRARDIPAFLAAGTKATPEMRRVSFGPWDRLVLVPMELTGGLKYSLLVVLALFVLAGFGRWAYSVETAWRLGGRAALLYLAGFLAGAVVTPILLPWLPGRAFSLKGACVGLVLALGYLGCRWSEMTTLGLGLDALAWVLMLPAVSAFFAMNFTGASTYTSLSGVRREMRLAVPAQVAGVVLGTGFWLAAHFI